MAASMALHLSRRRSKLPNPTFVHPFSTSPSPSSTSDNDSNPKSNSNDDSPQNQNQNPNPNPYPSSSSLFSPHFSDIKTSLKTQLNQKPSSHRPPPSPPLSSSPPPFLNPKAASLEEIRRNLSKYGSRSTTSSPPPYPSVSSSRDATGTSDPTASPRNNAAAFSFQSIKDSISKIRNSSPATGRGRATNLLSMSDFKNSLKLRPSDRDVNRTTVIGGGPATLPMSVFGKEMREKTEGEEEESGKGRAELWKMYSFGELGEKLRKLRPEGGKKEDGFSLGELNERLVKLRELEQKESESNLRGVAYSDLRQSLVKLRNAEEEIVNKTSIQRLDVLGQMSATPDFMLKPPKDELVEKYFHPDNMSSAEKMKIELQKVRDEFKMSESDCGSTRVQVAQLTTKIKHLSSVLHKKDKHSRRGLQGMLQRRKKLLKYLRRTDWDSYCLVLSKLGLRDSADLRS